MSIFWFLTIVFLCLLSVSDIRTKTIPGWAAPAFGIAVGILHLFVPGMTFLQCLAGLIPGVCLLLVSLAFRSGVGCGDACTLMACGAALGAERAFAALTAAFVFCAVFCVILLLRKKIRRSDCIPFLPFLASSHIVMLIAEVIS